MHSESLVPLQPAIHSVAQKLLEAKKQNRFILLKYHHDADGISAALALLTFLPAKAVQQNAAVYNAREALKDLSLLQHETQPLVILLDLGSGEESREGLQLLKAAGVETVIMDHHPIGPSIPPLVSILLNPWTIPSNEIKNPSGIPSGYLACEVARVAGAVDKNLEMLARVSCAGDKSDLLEISESDIQKALVLDYLAMHSGAGNLSFYKKALENEELFSSLLVQVREKIRELAERVKPRQKEKNFGKLRLYILELETLLKEQDFPSKGKIITYLLEQHPSNDPAIFLGYGNRTIVLRATQAAVDEGYALNALIEQLKPGLGAFIESGGGHAKAAAIRVRKGFAKEVVNAFVHLLQRSATRSLAVKE